MDSVPIFSAGISRRGKALPFFLFGLVICFTLFNLFIFTFQVLRALAYPYTLNYTEGHVLALSHYLYTRGSYFFDINNYPFIHAIYPPVFLFLTSLFFPVAGEKLVVGRLISLVATLGIVLVLYRIFSDRSRRSLISWCLALSFLMPSYVIEWAALNRVDMLGVFLSLAGMYCYVHFSEQHHFFRWLAVPCFILAFYTKQSFFAAPISLTVYLLFYDRREAAKFIPAYYLPLGALFVYFNFLTQGQWYLHLVTYTRSIGFDFSTLFYWLQSFFKLFALPLACLFFNIIIQRKYPIYSLYAVMMFIPFFSTVKAGSGAHYFLEPAASFLIIFGLVLCDLMESRRADEAVWLGLFILFLLSLVSVDKISDIMTHPMVPAVYREQVPVNAYLQAAQGPILAEDLSFYFIHQSEPVSESYGSYWLTKFYKMDISRLLDDCEQEKFALIVAGNYILNTPSLAACIKNRYVQVDRLKGLYGEGYFLEVYEPPQKHD